MWTISSGFLKGNGRSRTVSITLKIALFAPIPRARVRIAMMANTGAFISIRRAYLRSVIIRKLQIPSTKLQRNSKHQAAKTRQRRSLFGAWSFSGAWMLVLGASYDESVAQLDDPIPVGRIHIRVRDLNDRGALAIQRLEHLHDLLPLIGVQVARRLVGQDQFSIRDHRARNADELLLPARKLARI